MTKGKEMSREVFNYLRDNGKLTLVEVITRYSLCMEPPHYPVPAIPIEMDYLRDAFSHETVSLVLWDMSVPNNPIAAYFFP